MCRNATPAWGISCASWRNATLSGGAFSSGRSPVDNAVLRAWVPKLAGKRVLVVGDVMADHYVWGKVERISPEAPIPVVHVSREEVRPGGAANVASNIAALGGRVSLAGIVG